MIIADKQKIPKSKIEAKINELEGAIILGTTAFETRDGVEWVKEKHDYAIKELKDLLKEDV